MNRRGFLRFLGAGAAAAVAAPIIKPKSFFSFFGTGEVWKPPVYEWVSGPYEFEAPLASKYVVTSVKVLWHDEYDLLTDADKLGQNGVMYARLGEPTCVVRNIDARYLLGPIT